MGIERGEVICQLRRKQFSCHEKQKQLAREMWDQELPLILGAREEWKGHEEPSVQIGR